MPETSNDHDLLIALNERVKDIQNTIKEMKDGTNARVDDHETRLRRLELWGGIAIGLGYAVQFLTNFLK